MCRTYKTRIYIYMRTKQAYIWEFCMHIHASKRHVYMRLKCLVKNNTLN